MEDSTEKMTETQRISQFIIDAMRLSTDPVTAASAEIVPSLKIGQADQAIHLARCIAAFTTDDTLANDMIEFVGESPKFLIGKVMAVNFPPEQCTGEFAELEKRIWKSLYAGRRERSRVQETLTRRGAI
ncbi:hypothetical protein [Propionivibrio sp.]|uniref:hypothetical protein n=1 Tax=Propionivibrio sp. TaxID=2212460 RepID=UPI003BF2B784